MPLRRFNVVVSEISGDVIALLAPEDVRSRCAGDAVVPGLAVILIACRHRPLGTEPRIGAAEAEPHVP